MLSVNALSRYASGVTFSYAAPVTLPFIVTVTCFAVPKPSPVPVGEGEPRVAVYATVSGVPSVVEVITPDVETDGVKIVPFVHFTCAVAVVLSAGVTSCGALLPKSKLFKFIKKAQFASTVNFALATLVIGLVFGAAAFALTAIAVAAIAAAIFKSFISSYLPIGLRNELPVRKSQWVLSDVCPQSAAGVV